MARARRKGDPVEHAIEDALDPGRFVHDRACFSFVTDLEQVEAEIERIVRMEPQRAVALYEAFVAGCYEKANEVDDSSGSLGTFVADLFCGWIQARQAMRASPDETASRLLTWMDDDPFGFAYELEKDAARALNKAGLAALASQIRARFEAASQPAPARDEERARNTDFARRRWCQALRGLLLAQKDIEAYVRLVEETGVTGDDCHGLATMLVGRRRLEEALTWIERGLALDGGTSRAAFQLADLKGQVLKKMGREDVALEAAWARYREHPSRFRYDDLFKFVPKDDRPAWHAKAIDAATGADLYSLIELLVHTKEIDRLAALIGSSSDQSLAAVSHSATEPAARRLEKNHPAEAARLWRAQAMRILEQKKNRYYGAALQHLKLARRCYDKAGKADSWQRLVDEIREKHNRKTGFMPEFERMASGNRPSGEPAFLDQAKARWTIPR